jgi:primosomal replication protein N
MPPTERELEERSVQMEAQTARDLATAMKEVEAGRKKRREEGNGTAADTVAGWFGW